MLMIDSLHSALITLNRAASKEKRGERRRVRNEMTRELITRTSRVDVLDLTAPGFAPWDEKRLREKRLLRMLKIWAKRKRNPERGAFARKALQQIAEKKAAATK